MIELVTQPENVFREVVYTLAETEILPEISRNDLEGRIKGLMLWSQTGETWTCRTPTGTAFVIVAGEEYNPHIEGKGISVQITMSTDTSALQELMRYVFRQARLSGYQWILTTKRVTNHEYRIKYHILRK